MPRNLPHYTRCAAPGDAYSITTADNIFFQILGAIAIGGAVGSAMWAVTLLLGHVASLGCIIGTGVGGTIIYGIVTFKHWYYNERLMCIKHDQCAVGTVVGEPHDALDGDRKLDLLIAPFNVPEVEQLLIEMLDEMRGELPNVPNLPDLQNRQVRLNYVQGLGESDKKRLYIRMVDEKLFADPARRFQRHYYRRDEGIMGSDAFNHSPDDTLAASDPNPMFRYSAEEGGDPEEGVMVPWMHCEVEGNRLGRWLDNVLIGFSVAFASYVAICAICTTVTLGAGGILCGWLGGAIAVVIGFIAWLISHFVNDPDDAVAGEIDVDVEDPDFDTPDTESRPGDVVFLFGNWIMDTEHAQYFEIHPVKAYYLLCQDASVEGDWLLTEEVPAADCELDPNNITAEDMERMCEIVTAAEKTDPEEKLTIEKGHAMAMFPPG